MGLMAAAIIMRGIDDREKIYTRHKRYTAVANR